MTDIEVEVQGVEAGTDWTDPLEILAYLSWADYMVAILERVPRPFGCALLAISLDSPKPPAHYEKLLKRSGVRVLGIELFGGSNLGDVIINGAACITVLKKDVRKAVRVLARAGALFAY